MARGNICFPRAATWAGQVAKNLLISCRIIFYPDSGTTSAAARPALPRPRHATAGVGGRPLPDRRPLRPKGTVTAPLTPRKPGGLGTAHGRGGRQAIPPLGGCGQTGVGWTWDGASAQSPYAVRQPRADLVSSPGPVVGPPQSGVSRARPASHPIVGLPGLRPRTLAPARQTHSFCVGLGLRAGWLAGAVRAGCDISWRDNYDPQEVGSCGRPARRQKMSRACRQ